MKLNGQVGKYTWQYFPKWYGYRRFLHEGLNANYHTIAIGPIQVSWATFEPYQPYQGELDG